MTHSIFNPKRSCFFSFSAILLVGVCLASGNLFAAEIVRFTFNTDSTTIVDEIGGESTMTLDAGSSIVIDGKSGYMDGSATAPTNSELRSIVPSTFDKEGSVWCNVVTNETVPNSAWWQIVQSGTSNGLDNRYSGGSIYMRQPSTNWTGIVQPFTFEIGHEYNIAGSWRDSNSAGYTFRYLYIEDVTAGTGWVSYSGHSPVHASGSDWALLVSSLGDGNYIDEFRLYDDYYASITGASFENATPVLIPEPASLALLAVGGSLLAVRRRRK